jgi:uncharacterized membrane protein
VFLAAIFVGLGIEGLVTGDFGQIWPTLPDPVPARAVLVYACAIVSLTTGLGLLWQRTAAASARALLGYLFLWCLCFRAPPIVREPGGFFNWYNLSQTMVLVSAVWVLYAGLAGEWDRRHVGFLTGDRGVRIARVPYGLALVQFGVAHFNHLDLTAPLVPHWLHAPVAWAYFTGGAFMAAGIAVLTGVAARLAASLVALQIGLFTLLIWVPLIVTGPRGPDLWTELVVSSALTAGAWVIADSYTGTPWLARARLAVLS